MSKKGEQFYFDNFIECAERNLGTGVFRRLVWGVETGGEAGAGQRHDKGKLGVRSEVEKQGRGLKSRDGD